MVAAVLAFWGPLLDPSRMDVARDGYRLFLPLEGFIREALRSGRLPPGWYPFDGPGAPLVGSMVPGLLHPRTLLLLLPGPLSFIHGLIPVALALQAAFGGVVLGRTLGLGTRESRLLGAAFACSGYLTSQALNPQYLSAAAQLPWGMAAFGRLAAKATVQRGLSLGVALAWFIWAGDPNLLLGCGAAGAVWLLLRPGPLRARAVALAAGVAMFLALSAPVLLPASTAFSASARTGGLPGPLLRIWSLHPARLLELLWGSPFPPGGPMPDAFGGDGGEFWSQSVALGPALAALALLALASRGRWVRPVGGMALLALGAALGPKGGLFHLLPLQSRFRFPEKWVAPATLALCVLAALGMARLRTRKALPAWGWTLLPLATVLPAFALLPLAPGEGSWLPMALKATAALLLVRLGVGFAPRPVRATALASLALGTHLLLTSPGFGLVPVAGFDPERQPRPEVPAWSVLCGPDPTAVEAATSTEALRKLRELAPPNLAGLVGLRHAEAVLPTETAALERLSAVVDPCDDAFATLVGVTHTWLPTAKVAATARIAARSPDGALALVESEPMPPWARVGPALPYEASEEHATIAGIHFRKVPPEALHVRQGLLQPFPPLVGSGEATVELREADHFRLRVRSEAPALLGLRESWSPDWQATVDGAPTPTLPVALGLLGVPLVEAGSHEVELRFVPRGWPGVLVPWAVGLIVWAAGWASLRRGRRTLPGTRAALAASSHAGP